MDILNQIISLENNHENEDIIKYFKMALDSIKPINMNHLNFFFKYAFNKDNINYLQNNLNFLEKYIYSRESSYENV